MIWGLAKLHRLLVLIMYSNSLKPEMKLFIVAPKSTLRNAWDNDMSKFFNMDANVYAAEDVRAENLSYDKPVVINYEALSYMFREDAGKLPILDDSFVLVLDELLNKGIVRQIYSKQSPTYAVTRLLLLLVVRLLKTT